ncbi:MAG: cytochrome c [Acidimicrobiia bacterium]|nr:cytochrome c [Acidimicrobiia bacterium]
MTEVPEHLLKRSRDRRNALEGGGGDATSAPVPAAASETESAPAATAAAPVAAATPAVVEPPPPYVEAALRRKRIPIWVMPVLAFLPLWAVIYIGGLSPASTGAPSQLETGKAIYAANCASCHGSAGGGGVGRPMNDGNLVKTFPDIIGQLDFVWLGSNGTGPAGTPYGDPAREGGQHKTLSWNGNPMPNFDKALKQAQLLAVVRYEWEVLSGGKVTVDAKGDITYANGKPMLNAAGELITPDGQPLLDPAGKLTIQPNWTTPTGS